MDKKAGPNVVAHLMQPDLQKVEDKELLNLFLDLSKKFTSRLDGHEPLPELCGLQAHMRLITAEIERRHKG